MSARIRDVAERAQVSTATVSHVLNGTRTVTDSTRDRVLTAIRELNYHPSAVARSLKTQSTYTLGVMVSDITNPFSTAVVRGIEDVASANGFNLILCNTDENEDKAEAYVRLLLARRVDGLVLAPTGRSSDLLERFREMAPIVVIDRADPGMTLPFVGVDNVAGARKAVNHLVDDGHTRIGIVAGLPAVSTSAQRLEGYRLALARRGMAADPDLERTGQSTVEGGEQAAVELLSLAERPTALFTTNNFMTLGALRACARLGLRCPDDVAILGFDDHEWAPLFTPPLSVVRQPTYEIGTTAAALLLRAIAGERLSTEPRLLNTTLLIRESCRRGGHPAEA